MGSSSQVSKIAVYGPGVFDALNQAVALYREVHAGNWAAAVDLQPDKFGDPDAARTQFDRLAATVQHQPIDQDTQVLGAGSQARYIGPRLVLMQAVDLYMRLLLGQYSELAWATGNGHIFQQPSRLRHQLQRHGAWPDSPSASWAIGNTARVPDAARVAYDVWKLLGGGIPERGVVHGGVTLVVESEHIPTGKGEQL